MNTGASYANEDTQVPACPSRMFIPLAIRAALVRFQLDKLFQRIAITLRRALRHRSPRHSI